MTKYIRLERDYNTIMRVDGPALCALFILSLTRFFGLKMNKQVNLDADEKRENCLANRLKQPLYFADILTWKLRNRLSGLVQR